MNQDRKTEQNSKARQNNKAMGAFGETAAAKYLKAKGYQIVERNFACKGGEIDLIARRKGCLVFAEVKTRQSDRYGTPAEAVGYTKQKKIISVAQYYLLTYDEDSDIRFDVIEVYASRSCFGGYKVQQINHIENAF